MTLKLIYSWAIRCIDANSHTLDITKFITNNIKLELISRDEESSNSDLNENIDVDSHRDNTLKMFCEYHETPSLRRYLGSVTTAQSYSFLHINARSLIKKSVVYFK